VSILHLDRHSFHLLTITSLSGGFLIGGGSAFPTFEHGFGSNVAVNFEVVLASGEVVNVNEKRISFGLLRLAAPTMVLHLFFPLEMTEEADMISQVSSRATT